MFFAYSVECWEHDGLVPMFFAYSVEGWEHDGHDDLVVLLYEGHDILIIPEVESSLGHLEVGTGHTLGNLFEQRFLDFDKLSRLNHVQNLLYFTKKHHFFL